MVRLATVLQDWLAVRGVRGHRLVGDRAHALLPRHDPLGIPRTLILLMLEAQLFLCAYLSFASAISAYSRLL